MSGANFPFPIGLFFILILTNRIAESGSEFWHNERIVIVGVFLSLSLLKGWTFEPENYDYLIGYYFKLISITKFVAVVCTINIQSAI